MFTKDIEIDYPQGGHLSDLNGYGGEIKFQADSKTPGVSEIIAKINDNLGFDQKKGGPIVSDLSVEYSAEWSGMKDHAKALFYITLKPVIKNLAIYNDTDLTSSVLLDSSWRGFKVNSPVIIKNSKFGYVDINTPFDFFKKTMTPKEYEILRGNTKVNQLLNDTKMMDASPFLEPLSTWHHDYYPMGIHNNVQEINQAVTIFTIGYQFVPGIMSEGPPGWPFTNEVKFTADNDYTVKISDHGVYGYILVNGYSDSVTKNGTEYFTSYDNKIPEFGQLADIVLVIAILGIILMTIRINKFSFLARNKFFLF